MRKLGESLACDCRRAIPDVLMLETLADIRVLVEKHLPAASARPAPR
jgi:hypothetical protein